MVIFLPHMWTHQMILVMLQIVPVLLVIKNVRLGRRGGR